MRLTNTPARGAIRDRFGRIGRRAGALIAAVGLGILASSVWTPVDAAPATHFSVVAPPTATVGTSFSFTVTALDGSNTPDTSYSGTVHFTASDGAATLPADVTLTNGVGTFTATLTTPGTQSLTATDTVTSSITGTSNGILVSDPADLAVAKVVSNSTPNVGDTVTFTVTLVDSGPDVATSVSVVDLLPAGLTFVSATPSQGTYNAATGSWTVGTVTPGTPQTLTLQATVVSSSSMTNTATITGADQFDPNTTNNAASTTVTPTTSTLPTTTTTTPSTTTTTTPSTTTTTPSTTTTTLAPSAALPRTGSEANRLLAVATLSLLLGEVLLLLFRRRVLRHR